MFVIEKGVPMPAPGPQSMKYGWDKMEVGDSIFVPQSAWPEGKTAENMRTTIYNAARKYGAPKGISYKSLITTRTITKKVENPEFSEHDVGEPSEVEAEVEEAGIRTWMMSGPVDQPVVPAVKPDPVRTDEGDQTRDPQV